MKPEHAGGAKVMDSFVLSLSMSAFTLSERRSGLLAAIVSYLFWGFMSVYWSLLAEADSWEVIAHRVLWSLVFLLLAMALRGKLNEVLETARLLWADRRRLMIMLSAAFFAALNWWINVIAVLTDHVVELGIGTFLTPLISVSLGVIFFGERLSLLKKGAIALAAVGVGIMIVGFGHFPWISLGVSLTWGIYGALKKKLMLEAWVSIILEAALMLPAALAYIGWLHAGGLGHFGTGGIGLTLALAGTGIMTSIPLICFTLAAMKLPMNVLGFCQYIAPVMTLLLGIFWFGEPFGGRELLPLIFIWSGIALFLFAELRPLPNGRDTL